MRQEPNSLSTSGPGTWRVIFVQFFALPQLLYALSLSGPWPLCVCLRTLRISKFEGPVCIPSLCLDLHPVAYPDFFIAVALQWLQSSAGLGGALLPLSGAVGGGVASFLVLLEAPQGLILPECHWETELVSLGRSPPAQKYGSCLTRWHNCSQPVPRLHSLWSSFHKVSQFIS